MVSERRPSSGVAANEAAGAGGDVATQGVGGSTNPASGVGGTSSGDVSVPETIGDGSGAGGTSLGGDGDQSLGCDDAGPCTSDAGCSQGCSIGGECYANGAPSPDNPCQRCDVTLSTSTFSPLAAGSFCGRGEQCNAEGSCELTGVGIVATSTNVTCGIVESGRVRCWGAGPGLGYDSSDDIGDDEAPASLGDIDFGHTRRALQIQSGGGTQCALFEGGSVRCWGFEFDGLLGNYPLPAARADGTYLPRDLNDVPLGGPARQISMSAGHACAVMESGGVRCWGTNPAGELGYNDLEPRGDDPGELPPLEIDLGGERARQVSVGGNTTCVVLEGGGARCWGYGIFGELGYGNQADLLAPAQDIELGAPAVQIATSGSHTCAVLAGGRLKCWGSGSGGVLGYGNVDSIGDDELPSAAGDVPVGFEVAQVEVGFFPRLTCARSTAGAVRCWGDNSESGLGYTHTTSIGDDATPAAAALPGGIGGDLVLGNRPALSLSVGARCALLDTLALRCWGANDRGQLGKPEFPQGSLGRTPADIGAISWE
ncbi:MAG: hypothetical protein ABW217_18410 [Polyangiaceae bacterium]